MYQIQEKNSKYMNYFYKFLETKRKLKYEFHIPFGINFFFWG